MSIAISRTKKQTGSIATVGVVRHGVSIEAAKVTLAPEIAAAVAARMQRAVGVEVAPASSNQIWRHRAHQV